MNLFTLINTDNLKPHQLEALAWLQTHIDNQVWATFKDLWQGKAYLKVAAPRQESSPLPLERLPEEGEAWRS